MDLQDDVYVREAVSDGIRDENIDRAMQNRGSQVFPPSGGEKRVLRAQNDFEMRKELRR